MTVSVAALAKGVSPGVGEPGAGDGDDSGVEVDAGDAVAAGELVGKAVLGGGALVVPGKALGAAELLAAGELPGELLAAEDWPAAGTHSCPEILRRLTLPVSAERRSSPPLNRDRSRQPWPGATQIRTAKRGSRKRRAVSRYPVE